jgi:hypothetical protein
MPQGQKGNLAKRRLDMKRKRHRGAAMVLVMLGLGMGAQAAELKVGDKAPDFTLPDQNGNAVSLSSFQGKKNVVLAFYVLAFTGG